MHKVLVLGAGRIGSLIARDLSEDAQFSVTVADRRSALLETLSSQRKIATVLVDLGDPAVTKTLAGSHDFVIGALPGSLGYTALEGIALSGRPCIDISFMPRDARQLHDTAKAHGTSIVYDFGVSPGIASMLATSAARELGGARQVRILVGGLPMIRRQPWEYAAPFSPADVLAEYVRPARIKVGGRIVAREALSGLEQIEFPEVGTLEAFHTDGLRTLLETMDCPSMEEKTLRYPGYADKIRLLRDSGFLDSTPRKIGNVEIAPIDLTLSLLEPAWSLPQDVEEFTLLRVLVIGHAGPPYKRIVWNMFDRSDRYREEHSLARCTGYAASITARRVLDGSLSLCAGVHPPESLCEQPSFLDQLLEDLKNKGITYRKT